MIKSNGNNAVVLLVSHESPVPQLAAYFDQNGDPTEGAGKFVLGFLEAIKQSFDTNGPIDYEFSDNCAKYGGIPLDREMMDQKTWVEYTYQVELDKTANVYVRVFHVFHWREIETVFEGCLNCAIDALTAECGQAQQAGAEAEMRNIFEESFGGES